MHVLVCGNGEYTRIFVSWLRGGTTAYISHIVQSARQVSWLGHRHSIVTG